MTTQSSAQPSPNNPSLACSECGTARTPGISFCAGCGRALPLAYTGPTQHLVADQRMLIPPNAPAPTIDVVDEQTREAVLLALSRGNREAAIHAVIDAYTCHWTTAEQVVAKIVAQSQQPQHVPKSLSPIVALQIFVLMILVFTIAIWAFSLIW